VTGSFDASAAIWKRWEENAGGGLKGEAQEIDFTGGLAGGDPDGDNEDDEWRLEVILDGHDSEIKSVTFCPTAPLLATCSRDKSVWIWEELEGDNFETMAVLQEHEGDVKCVAWHPTEQLLASGSYDDNVRLWREDVDDWACCTLLDGHKGTVWWVEFEGSERKGLASQGGSLSHEQKSLLELREKAGPRLITCSDDKTIRIWRKVPTDKPPPPTGQGKIPTIWKNRDFEEEWIEEMRLPQSHERPVYSVSWSKKTGRVVSTGSDGKIVVYEEVWNVQSTDSDTALPDSPGPGDLSKWVVAADVENAHDVFEINHVTWAPRADKGRRNPDEEVIISTGDDGEVKIWTLDD
jgi:WD40 repeat protein